MLKDIYNLLKSITFIDYVFFFTVIFLIILVICLVYFIKINGKVVETEDILDDPDNLKAIADKIENTPAKPVTFTSYEQEQEEKAIISYDELVKKNYSGDISYSDTTDNDDILVKQVDLTDTQRINLESIKDEKVVNLLDYKHEEQFLEELKDLDNKLGNL